MVETLRSTSFDELLRSMEESVAEQGYDRVSALLLSTCSIDTYAVQRFLRRLIMSGMNAPVLILHGEKEHIDAIKVMRVTTLYVESDGRTRYHAKFGMVVGRDALHLTVTSRNLIEGSAGDLAWTKRFPARSRSPCDFGVTDMGDGLERFLEAAGASVWCSTTGGIVKGLDRTYGFEEEGVAGGADFSDLSASATSQLVYTIPGGSNMSSASSMAASSGGDVTDCIVCAASSVGRGLGVAFIRQFDSWCPDLNLLEGGRFKVLWPTFDYVSRHWKSWSTDERSLGVKRRRIGAKSDGSTRCFMTMGRGTWTGLCPDLKSSFCESEGISHAKYVMRLGRDGTVRWILVTSANLSPAAWGLQAHNNFEMGVLLKGPFRLKCPCGWKDDGIDGIDTFRPPSCVHGPMYSGYAPYTQN
jgi:hypothetical protein